MRGRHRKRGAGDGMGKHRIFRGGPFARLSGSDRTVRTRLNLEWRGIASGAFASFITCLFQATRGEEDAGFLTPSCLRRGRSFFFDRRKFFIDGALLPGLY